MSVAYGRVMYGCAALSVLGGTAFTALTIAAASVGRDSGLQLPWRLTNIILTMLGVSGAVAAQAWLTRNAHAASAAELAAMVTVEVVNHLEARIVKVAEKAAGANRGKLLSAMREMVDELRTDLAEEMRSGIQAARMHGEAESLMRDAQDRARDSNGNGNVSSIRRSE